ncbi:MAG TPA: DNA-binding response regulator [Marinilabiliales bacterium]|jgi:two-component system LytT family response regulator|nr:DNA-binding response regulator [Marinilabiliales bacterium]HAZ02989.1 DNA-binding response regulator [Marinilabiliales bacterium]HBO75874.1 DNA-binding response regulator [Marinilabiliales bacterium]HBX83296.1 DNA-binding response regulator [Marinilabiliales bacterium]HBY54008.1 DNA-binding response regulator [Marinilabiliales bacterium]
MVDAKIRALVVDDERLARKDLTSMLADFPEIAVVGEAQDVPSAIKAIEAHHPDLIFLDIQMPGQTGFDLVEQIDFSGKIIFVTAFDEFALRAFEINALDYLMKPVSPDRLKKALTRLQPDEESKPTEYPPLQYEDRIFTTMGNKVQFLKVNSIVLIQAEGDYTYITCNNGQKGLVTKAMKEWEERLPEKQFCRVHRNAIINTDYIEDIEKWFNYSYRVLLKGIKEEVIISRRYAKKLKDMFG